MHFIWKLNDNNNDTNKHNIEITPSKCPNQSLGSVKFMIMFIGFKFWLASESLIMNNNNFQQNVIFPPMNNQVFIGRITFIDKMKHLKENTFNKLHKRKVLQSTKNII